MTALRALPGAACRVPCLWAAIALGGSSALVAPAAVRAQSLLAAEGLGVLVEPLDARSRALGGAGIGLAGWHLLNGDPAAAAGLTLTSVGATFQPSSTTLTGGESAGYTRFPALGASYSLAGNVFSIQLGAFLDQEWEATSTAFLEVGGQDVEVRDIFRSTGSIARVRLGWARPIVESLAVGVTLGSHVGTVERVFTRALNPEDVGAGVELFQTGERFRASGAVVSGGVAWDPSPLLRVAGSLSWSDDLVLSPSGDSEEEEDDKRYRMPLELRAGGTFALTPDLSLHLGTTFADWTDTGEDLANGTARGATWSYGGGVEWSAATLAGRAFPLRVGVRHRDLPFQRDGQSAFERTVSGGAGLNLLDVEAQPLARLEFGIERGRREAGSLSEDFWRVAVSIRVASG